MLCFFFKQKTAYEMLISDWSSDVCSSDLRNHETSDFQFLSALPSAAAPAQGATRAEDDGEAGEGAGRSVGETLRRQREGGGEVAERGLDRKSTRLNSSH